MNIILNKMKHKTPNIVLNEAGVCTAAVCDYLMNEVLDISGFYTKKIKRKIIQPEHVETAVKADSELNELFGHLLPRSGP